MNPEMDNYVPGKEVALLAEINRLRSLLVGSVLQEWAMRLGRRHQGVLLCAVRGCDGRPSRCMRTQCDGNASAMRGHPLFGVFALSNRREKTPSGTPVRRAYTQELVGRIERFGSLPRLAAGQGLTCVRNARAMRTQCERNAILYAQGLTLPLFSLLSDLASDLRTRVKELGL